MSGTPERLRGQPLVTGIQEATDRCFALSLPRSKTKRTCPGWDFKKQRGNSMVTGSCKAQAWPLVRGCGGLRVRQLTFRRPCRAGAAAPSGRPASLPPGC